MIDWELFYSSLRTPDFLPGYEIQNRLGGGAFGDVYKARKHSIGKAYAVKFLKVTEGEVVERELHQVQLFAAIDHPNLVTVEDVGVVMGVPYVIMGYAGEDTLARRMKRGEFERTAMLRTFVQVCRGVLALHDRRLAHFDLKPSNVFLRGDVARVGDYGLAKLLQDGKQTLSFGRGTPRYMAPEMMRNRADHRADIYSLGIILYEVLARKLPFDMDEGVFVREEDVLPEFPEDFPPALRPVVVKATRLDPDDRYATVRELLDEMEASARRGDPVLLDALTAESGSKASDGEADEDSDVDFEEPETPVPDDLRRAAAELARGAVGVAKGVWEGVRTRSSEAWRRRGPAEEPTPVPDELGGEVVSFQTLDDPDDYAETEAASKSTPRTPLLSALADERERRAGLLGDGGSQTFSPWDALPAVGAPSVGRTVPVPPATEGGIVGSIAATLVLGFEVMVAILSGPVFYVLRSVGRGVDRAFQPVPGLFGSTLKLILFLLLLALLGGLTSLVAMMTLMA